MSGDSNVDPNADTVELPQRPSARPEAPLSFSSFVWADVAAISDRGKRRPSNEDHFLVARLGRHFEVVSTSLPAGEVPDASEESGYGMVVADGMGGMAGGEVASRVAIRTLVELALKQPDWIMRLNDETAAESMWRARQRYQMVNEELGRQAQEHPALANMGTTMTLAYSLGVDLFVAHVGDSRAYRFHQGQLQQLTRDHTLAQRLQDLGEISPQEAASHRLRHVLTNSLGRQVEKLPVDVQRLQLCDNDCLLLCSDGLTEMLDETEISDAIASDRSAADTCRTLVDLALERGGVDNITAIVARYRFPDAVL